MGEALCFLQEKYEKLLKLVHKTYITYTVLQVFIYSKIHMYFIVLYNIHIKLS